MALKFDFVVRLKKYFKNQNELQLITLLQQYREDLNEIEKDSLFRNILNWIQGPHPISIDKNQTQTQSERLNYLVDLIRANNICGQNFKQLCHSVVANSFFLDLLIETGLEDQPGFLRELFDRTFNFVVPQYEDTKSFKRIFSLIFKSEHDLAAMQSLDREKLKYLSHEMFFCFNSESGGRKFKETFKQSIDILLARMLGIIVDRDLRNRLQYKSSPHKSFFRLQSYLIERRNSDQLLLNNELTEIVTECFNEIQNVYPTLEKQGVSIDLVYKIEALKSILERVELLADCHDALVENRFQFELAFERIGLLAFLNLKHTNLLSFLGRNLNLLAKKIVERNSVTGEHYIAKDKEEYLEMFMSAAGGGLFTSVTTLIKILINKLHLPLFIEGVFSGLNYALSFIAIQLSHFTLATKTPAMTATTLANRLGQQEIQTNPEKFVDDTVAIFRSAFIAVVGNLGLVIPGCFLIDLIWLHTAGHHLLTNDLAIKEIKKLSPLTSLTLIYAGFTGAILWAASILGAWFENWCVFRRQFDILSQSKLIERVFGAEMRVRIVNFALRNTAGISTNVFLGFMLSFFGIAGQFFGLPLEVRHVTLSTGQLTYGLLGVESMNESLFWVISAITGIFFIGLLNFTVSFSLSLLVASRARNLSLSQIPFLIQHVLVRLRQNPKSFFRPESQTKP